MWISWSASVEFKCVSVIPRISKRHMFCISLSSSILLHRLQIFRCPTRMYFEVALSSFTIPHKSSALVAKSAVKFPITSSWLPPNNEKNDSSVVWLNGNWVNASLLTVAVNCAQCKQFQVWSLVVMILCCFGVTPPHLMWYVESHELQMMIRWFRAMVLKHCWHFGLLTDGPGFSLTSPLITTRISWKVESEFAYRLTRALW